MNYRTIQAKKVISVMNGINEKIIGRIAFHNKDDGYYFISVEDIKKNIHQLNNIEVLHKITDMFASEKDFERYIKLEKINVEDYEIINHNIPEILIDLNI